METSATPKTIIEPTREVEVYHESDVVVVGGGPAGVAAAIAAARNGANTVLVERYGHLGGMATGGLVLVLPHVFAGIVEDGMVGLCQEIIDRLDIFKGALHPKKEEVGSSDKEVTAYWHYRTGHRLGDKIRYSAYVDPEILKCVLNNMVEEAGVKLLLHSWGTQAIVDNDRVRGIIFESKSGRKAILAKLVVDATGDGDVFASAGADFEGAIDPKLRNSMLALVYRIGNVDLRKFSEFRGSPKYVELMAELTNSAGFRQMPMATTREDIVWFNNWLPGLNCLKVEDLTQVEVSVRKTMLLTHDFFRKNVPGFEKSFIMDTASQLGTRGSRRLIGEYMVDKEDMRSGKRYEDTIAMFSSPVSREQPSVCIPYRSLVPIRKEGLLVAGRCFSSDPVVNDAFNLIPHCIVLGQVAGTAAALSLKAGVSPRKVDYGTLHDTLINQGMVLPK